MKKYLLIIITFLFTLSCIEEIAFKPDEDNFPEILVVEATLTNQLKHHQVLLSKLDTIQDLQIDSTFIPFLTDQNINRDLVKHVAGANVAITDDNGNTFSFVEAKPGTYISLEAFAAQENRAYELNINTTDGKSYSSTAMAISGIANITAVDVDKTLSDQGAEGLGVFVDSESVSGETQNLRFNFEETFKIIAPNWTSKQFLLTDYDPCALPVPTYNLEIVDKEKQNRICFRTELSTNIIQQNQDPNLSGGLDQFMVQFLGKDNFKISHRYSILVQQFVVSPASFAFYDKLRSFSQNGNIFSQIQPGFLEGNVQQNNGDQNTVIGFFDVVSVSEKRVFFNYTDFYPEDPLPPFPFKCTLLTAPESHESYCYSGPPAANPCPESVIERVHRDVITYVANNEDGAIGTPECTSDYIFVATPCGDCTTMGSNQVPEFWIE